MVIDDECKRLFDKKVNHLFCYINDSCDVECRHCILGPMKEYSMLSNKIDKEAMLNILEVFRKMGASKVTFLGGEPTLHSDLKKFVVYSKKLGYEYVALETNGLFEKKVLEDECLKQLDKIFFRLDDYDRNINNYIKGKDHFNQCVSNITQAVSMGYRVGLLCHIHNKLVIREQNNQFRFEGFIDFAEKLNVYDICFKPLLKTHTPCNAWTGDIGICFDDYLELLHQYTKYSKDRNINIVFPQRFVSTSEFVKNREKFGFCSVKARDRVHIFSDGTIRLCPLMIGSVYYTAYYDSKKISFNKGPTNEVLGCDINKYTPCECQNKRNTYIPYVPVCISIEPMYQTLDWIKSLRWNERKCR